MKAVGKNKDRFKWVLCVALKLDQHNSVSGSIFDIW